MFVVHYHKETGTIRAFGNDDGSTESFAGPEYGLTVFDEWHDLDPTKHKINVATGNIVKRSKTERAASRLPIIKAAIANELAATDQYAVADRPLSDAEREAWRTYRQALRDLTGSADAMIKAWPRRPDGVNPAEYLNKVAK